MPIQYQRSSETSQQDHKQFHRLIWWGCVFQFCKQIHHLIWGGMCFISIIGIPFAIQHLKLAQVPAPPFFWRDVAFVSFCSFWGFCGLLFISIRGPPLTIQHSSTSVQSSCLRSVFFLYFSAICRCLFSLGACFFGLS